MMPESWEELLTEDRTKMDTKIKENEVILVKCS
jgi:hypothetical protein